MNSPWRLPHKVLLLFAATAAIYSVRLDLLYLVHDEVVYALNALSIATTGRDLSGQFLPVSIPVIGTFFATPLNIYTTAIFLKLGKVSEELIRLPSVFIGAINVAFVFAVGRRVLGRERLAWIAAAMLALTPAHFIHSRLATDHIYVVTLMLAWLLCLIRVDREDQLGRISGATAFLGLGLYSYLGAAITMPVLLGLTIGFLYLRGFRFLTPYIVAVAAFAAVTFPFVLWHALHPDQYGKQMQMYGLARSSSTGLLDRVGVYWDYFSPSFLFFAGDTGLINGTRVAGVFLWPMLVLLPLGVVSLVRGPSPPIVWLVVLAFFASPLAATAVGERYRINRALVMLPLAVLIATAGLNAMWIARHRAWRIAAVLLVGVMPLQFLGFSRDYFTGYPARSYTWFEFNIAGGMESIIERERAQRVPVFIATNIQWAEYYWPLYLEKRDRADLVPLTTYVDVRSLDAVAAIPARAFVLCRNTDAGPLLAAGFHVAQTVSEPDGSSQFSVLER